MSMTGEEYRGMIRLCLAGKVSPAELREKGGIVGGRSNSKPKMKNGAGATKPGETVGADEGARARQPH